MPSFMEFWSFAIHFNDLNDSEVKNCQNINEYIERLGIESQLRFYDQETHLSMFNLPKDMRKQPA